MSLPLDSTRPLRPDLLAGEDLPPPPQQERSRRKRQALLEAALALFAERGYESTTIEDAAHRAGVAVGGFYQHFRSKRQVLLVLMDCLLEEVSRINIPLDGPQPGGVAASLAEVVGAALSLDLGYAGAHRAWSEAIVHDPGLAELNAAIETWTRHLVEGFVRTALSLPGARRDVDAGTLAWIVNLLFWKLAGRVSADAEAVVPTLAHLLYHTLFEDGAAGSSR